MEEMFKALYTEFLPKKIIVNCFGVFCNGLKVTIFSNKTYHNYNKFLRKYKNERKV